MLNLFEGKVDISGRKFSKVILGSDPFLMAPHFGHRATLYELDLYNQPDKVSEIIGKSYELGVRSIQIKNVDFLVEAVKLAKKDLDIIGVIGKNYKEDIATINPSIVLIDDFIVDSYDWDFISEILNYSDKKGLIAGLSTALPFQTSEKLVNSPIKDLFQVYMFPLNSLGYMMDVEFFQKEQREIFENNIKKLNKINIASRLLATGIETPKAALNFLKTIDYVDMINIGIAYEKEAEETWNTIFERI